MKSRELKPYLTLSVQELHQKLVEEELLEEKHEEDRNLAIVKFKEDILKQQYWKIIHHSESIQYVRVLNTELNSLSISISQSESTRLTIEHTNINILWFNVKHLYPYYNCLNICTPISKEQFESVLNIKNNILSHLKS